MSTPTSFFANLRERKIGQTAVVYLGTAWVLAEALSFFSQRYNWPSFLFDQFITIALCGLPAALITRWYQHSPPPDKKKLILLYAINVIVLVLASYVVFLKSGETRLVKNIVSSKSVAVLPFTNLSKDPEQEYFGDGIMEDIISKLYKIADLQVTSRTSALMYKQTKKNIQQIARELGVAYIVEGSVRKNGNKVRVTTRLIKAENDQNVWTETYDKSLEDIFYLQNELSEKIANGLQVTITASERTRITKIPTANTQAYEYYHQGRYHLSKSGKENIQLSKNLFNQAIREDPDFTLAYVGLAEYYIAIIDWGYASANQLADSIRLPLEAALRLDNTLGEVYASFGAYHLFFTHDFKKSQEAFEKAIQLNPGYDYAYYHYATLCTALKQFTKSQELITRGIHLNPLSTKFQGYKIQFYLMEHNYIQAELEVRQMLQQFPEDDFILWTLACTQVQLEQYPKAIQTFLKRKVASKETNWALGYAYAKMGETEKARLILDFLIEKSKSTYLPPTFIGLLYAGLGEYEKAMDYIEVGYTQGDNWVVYFEVHPWFDPLHSNPRFQTIVRRLQNSD